MSGGAAPTRREALRRGIAAGGTALAAAGVAPLVAARDASAEADDDVAILETAIELARTTVAAYAAAAGSRLLDAETRRTARLFRDQEQQHADALAAALGELGRDAPAARGRGTPGGVRDARSREDLLAFLAQLEAMAIAAYHDAHGRLGTARLLQTVASIMAGDAQQLVVLRQALGRQAVPSAFERGRVG